MTSVTSSYQPYSLQQNGRIIANIASEYYPLTLNRNALNYLNALTYKLYQTVKPYGNTVELSYVLEAMLGPDSQLVENVDHWINEKSDKSFPDYKYLHASVVPFIEIIIREILSVVDMVVKNRIVTVPDIKREIQEWHDMDTVLKSTYPFKQTYPYSEELDEESEQELETY